MNYLMIAFMIDFILMILTILGGIVIFVGSFISERDKKGEIQMLKPVPGPP